MLDFFSCNVTITLRPNRDGNPLSVLPEQPRHRSDWRALSEILFRYHDNYGPREQHEKIQPVLLTPAIPLPRRAHP